MIDDAMCCYHDMTGLLLVSGKAIKHDGGRYFATYSRVPVDLRASQQSIRPSVSIPRAMPTRRDPRLLSSQALRAEARIANS